MKAALHGRDEVSDDSERIQNDNLREALNIFASLGKYGIKIETTPLQLDEPKSHRNLARSRKRR